MDDTRSTVGGKAAGRSSTELASRLRLKIASGEYAVGGFLPSLRKLGADSGLSIETARRAMKTLEVAGLIVARPGSGYQVLPHANDPFVGCPIAFLNWNSGSVGSWGCFDDHLLAELKIASDKRGWSLLAMAAGNLTPGQVLERLSSARAFGVALSVLDENIIDAIRKTGIPALMLDQWVEGSGIDSLMQDGHQGGILAARYLVGLGCKEIAWFGPQNENAHTLARFGGSVAGLFGAGRTIDQILVAPEDNILPYAIQLLTSHDRPDAVIALWQDYAIALKRAADQCGLVIGKDFQMVGWNPEETFDTHYAPHFEGNVPPTITWSIRNMAQTAMTRMADRRNNPTLPALGVKIPVQLRLPSNELKN